MGYASYIGRVGALAVTLGVGVAMAAAPAYAETPSTTDSTSTSDSTTTSDTTPTGGTDPSAPDPESPSEPDNVAEGDLIEDDVTKDDLEDTENAENDLDDSDDNEDADDAEEAEESEEADDAEDAAEDAGAEKNAEDSEDTAGAAEKNAPVGSDSVIDTTLEQSEAQPPTPTASQRATLAEPGTDDTALIADQPLTAAAEPPVRSFSAAALKTDAIPTATTFTTVTAPSVPQPQPTLVDVVSNFVASLLRPLLSFGEGSPIQIPILTAVLSAVRNEFERILYPRTTKVAAQQTVSQLVDPTTQHVLVIGVDGANLSRILADDYNQNFFDLMDTSTTAASSIVGHTTISNPSWSAILTGVWGERTGVINNVFTPWTYDKWPTVYNQLETLDPDIRTAAIGNWNVINAIAGAGSIPADENTYIGQLPGDTNWLATDDAVADATVGAIAGANAPNFLFSYFVGVDENGHLYGGSSQQYRDAIRNMDDNLGEILAAVENREDTFNEDWTIIVVTDHGHQPQLGFGHGFQSPDETETFVIVDGPAFKDGYINLDYEIVDTTPTVVSLFGGMPRPRSDGVPLMTLSGSDVLPDDLHQALKAAIANNDYPDIVTNVALALRTIFATVPYYIYEFGNDFTADLPDFLVVPVKILFDGLYIATNVPAQIVAYLTGVSGASIFPLFPPSPPAFPDESAPDSVTLACETATADSICGESSVA